MTEQGLILLVEDDQNDVALVHRTFAKAGASVPIKVVRCAEDAMVYLKNEPPYTNRKENPTPALVLLDLKLPGLHGFELLQWIRSQAELKEIRVFVLTSSLNYQDLRQAYHLGADCFLTKPLEASSVVELVTAMQGPLGWMGKPRYWPRPGAPE